ncbi:MAG: hypothetical protein VX902_07260 [Planctomycetota bacterium]|nr:hypothetical protein [Planctomycetota bacterium]
MPRTLDPEHFVDSSAAQPVVLQVNPKEALAMYGVRMRMPDEPMLRRCFHAMVAMSQASHNCDYYITKYHAKPMEQLQSLLANIALGLERLEAEDEAAAALQSEERAEQPEERARKATLKIAAAANRSSWCSCCEMATFIKTGALARKTHRPVSIFLSRPKFLFEEFVRLQKSSNDMLLQAPLLSDDQTRPVDVLAFTATNVDAAAGPPELQADARSDANHIVGALPDVLQDSGPEDDDENSYEDTDWHSNSEPEDPIPETESGSAEQPATADGEPSSAAQIVNQSDHDADTIQESSFENSDTEAYEISALEATTSAHDDWLHRGPFLFDMDFHTYMRFTVRRPRPKNVKVMDSDRVEHVFQFDAHYALAASHWQELQTDGRKKLVMMEALRCPPSSLNNGEDNAVFKSLIGTLIKCPGPGQCANLLFWKSF